MAQPSGKHAGLRAARRVLWRSAIMRTIIATALFLTTFLVAPPTRADVPLTAEIDVTQSKGKDSTTATVVLSLTDKSAATAQIETQGGSLELELHREGGTDDDPVLALKVSRRTTEGKTTRTESWRVSFTIAAGKRAVVARLEDGGASTEIGATVSRP